MQSTDTTNEILYCITVTYRDDVNNKLIELGGAAWCTREEWDQEWSKIPSSVSDSSCIADKIDDNEDIVEDRFISLETVKSLLGKSLSQLIEDARRSQENASDKNFWETL